MSATMAQPPAATAERPMRPHRHHPHPGGPDPHRVRRARRGVLAVAGALLTVGHNFARDYVDDELSSQ